MIVAALLLACLPELTATDDSEVEVEADADTDADSDSDTDSDSDADSDADADTDVGFECAGASLRIEDEDDAVAAWRYSGVYEFNWFSHILFAWQDQDGGCPAATQNNDGSIRVAGDGCSDDWGFTWDGTMVLSEYVEQPYHLVATFEDFTYGEHPFQWGAEGHVTMEQDGDDWVLTLDLDEARSDFDLYTPFPSWSGWRDGTITLGTHNDIILEYSWVGVSVIDASETGHEGRFCWVGQAEVVDCETETVGSLELQGTGYARVIEDGDCDDCLDVVVGADDPIKVCD